jgi:hypothetical protein
MNPSSFTGWKPLSFLFHNPFFQSQLQHLPVRQPPGLASDVPYPASGFDAISQVRFPDMNPDFHFFIHRNGLRLVVVTDFLFDQFDGFVFLERVGVGAVTDAEKSVAVFYRDFFGAGTAGQEGSLGFHQHTAAMVLPNRVEKVDRSVKIFLEINQFSGKKQGVFKS